MKSLKFVSLGLVTLALLASSLFLVAPSASAQRYSRHDYSNFSRRMLRTDFDRPMVRILSDRNFFNSRNLFSRHPEFRSYLPNQIYGRRIVFVDRDNPLDMIRVSNRLTGPYSVNQAYVTIDHDSYSRLRNQLDIDQNIDISVNTGNNTVSFNTVVGSVTTGDVNIDIR